MYSRYVPDGRGGFARHPGPEPPGGPGPPAAPPEPEPERSPAELPPLPPEPDRSSVFRPPKPPEPRTPPPGRPPGPFPGARPPGRPNPGGLLQGLLPRGLDADDLLILAILVLAMRSGGADALTVAMAAGLYLLLGRAPNT